MSLLNDCPSEPGVNEETIPQVLSRLIRSREDALAIHQLLFDHIHFAGEGRDRCYTIGEILLLWDSFDFAEYFDGLQVEVEKLEYVLQNRTAKGINCATVLLQSLIIAAERQAEHLWAKFNLESDWSNGV